MDCNEDMRTELHRRDGPGDVNGRGLGWRWKGVITVSYAHRMGSDGSSCRKIGKCGVAWRVWQCSVAWCGGVWCGGVVVCGADVV